MKDNTLFIVKEVAICLGLAVIAVGANIFFLRNYAPLDVKVEKAKTDIYASIDQKKYVVINADIQEEQNPTQKYETENSELDIYQTEYRYIPGTINPFVSSGTENDLPTEVVGVSGDVTEKKK